MTYSTNIQIPVATSSYMGILRPRRIVTGFSVFSGSVYRASFTYGFINNCYQNSTELNLVSDTSLTPGDWYYDHANQYLYVRTTDSTAPSNFTITVAYEIYFATRSFNWYRNPLNVTTEPTYYEGILAKHPILRQSATDILFGFFPLESSNIELINCDGFLNKHLLDSSFNNTDIRLYHVVGDLDVTNIQNVFNGFTSGVSGDDNIISFTVKSKFNVFNKQYVDRKYFSSSDFPNLDPAADAGGQNQRGFPIRKIYGRIGGIFPVNIDFSESAATNTNRDWVVSQGQTNKATLNTTINTAGTNTLTSTTATNAYGIAPGDQIYITHAAGPDESVVVNTVDYVTGLITHTSLTGPRVVTVGDTIERPWINTVLLSDGDQERHLRYKEHWDLANFANDTSGFILADNFEASLGVATFDPTIHYLYCTATGDNDIPTYAFGGGPITTVSKVGGTVQNPLAVIYKLIRQLRDINPNEIDETSFSNIMSDFEDSYVGFMVPENKDDDFPTYKEIITKLMVGILLKMHNGTFNSLDAISVSKIEPLGAVDKTVGDDEIRTINFSIDYDDTYSDVDVVYSKQEIYNYLSGATVSLNYSRTKKATVPNSALYLHRAQKKFTAETYLVDNDEAQTLADRIAYALSDRRLYLTATVPNRFMDSKISDVVKLNRDNILGSEFVENTLAEMDTSVIKVSKGLDESTITLDDQKGIEDNSGSW